VYRGMERPNTRIIGRSFLAGVITAGAFGVLSLGFSDDHTDSFISDRQVTVALGLFAGASMALLGTLAGVFGAVEIWETVPLPVRPVGFDVASDGRVGVTFGVKNRE
jgi:hypothetical protein